MQSTIELITNLKKIREVTSDLETQKRLLELSRVEDIDEVIGMVINNSNSCGFNSECFKKYIADEMEFINFMECPEVDEGMFQCLKCSSKKIYTMSKQTRSGDEATTVFARCSKCKNGWIIN